MRSPRVRLTVGLMMGGIAAIALVLGLGINYRDHQAKALLHSRIETVHRQAVSRLGRDELEINPLTFRLDAAQEVIADHHRDLAHLHRRASVRPWVLIPPEPPPPTEDSTGPRLVRALIAKAAALGFTSLDLSGAGVTDDLMRLLERAPGLRELDLSRNPITDVGLTHLKGLPDLRRVNLSETLVSDAGFEILKGLPRLEHLILDGTRVTRVGVKGFGGTRPKITMEVDLDLISPFRPMSERNR